MHVGIFMGEFRPDAGGGYTFVNDVAESFLTVAAESNHTYTLFCSAAASGRFHSRGLPLNVKIVAITRRGALERAITTLKHVLPVFGYLWPWPSRLERIARSHNIELLWFIGGFFDTPDIPYIATVWDVQHLTHPWFPEVSSQWRWEYRELFLRRHLRRATAIITGTEVGKAELLTYYGLPPDRVHIIPHPTPAFALNAQSNGGESILKKFGLTRPYLFYPAQFWAHKNHFNLISALHCYSKSRGDAPDLVLAGSDKGNKGYIQECVEKLELGVKVHFLGFVSTDELTALYRNAIALVYPSFSGPENLPPLEAFALLCPVAISDYAGAREQLGGCALYFDATDPVSISKAIGQLLTEKSTREQMIASGKLRARTWTGAEYVRAVLKIAGQFEPIRRAWRADWKT